MMILGRSKPKEHWLREGDREFADRLAEADPRLAGVYDNALYRGLRYLERRGDLDVVLKTPGVSSGSLLKALAFKGGKSYPGLVWAEVIHCGYTPQEMAAAYWAFYARRYLNGRRSSVVLLVMGWILLLSACYALSISGSVFIWVAGIAVVFILAANFALGLKGEDIYRALEEARGSALHICEKIEKYHGQSWWEEWLFQQRTTKTGFERELLLVGVVETIAILACIMLISPSGGPIQDLPHVLLVGVCMITTTFLPFFGYVSGRSFRLRADDNFKALVASMESIRKRYLEDAPLHLELT